MDSDAPEDQSENPQNAADRHKRPDRNREVCREVRRNLIAGGRQNGIDCRACNARKTQRDCSPEK